WPAQFPDLNLIDVLWMDMETEFGQTLRGIGDIPVLERALSSVCHQIPAGRLESLICSMPKGLQAVIDVQGGPTPY
ncbi:hypothetical protein HOY82DRAFT_476724, partial [Tuber indicum]